MKIFNTLTRSKQELVPIKEGEFKIYACGPTVYNFIHIGNARPLCVFDVMRRYLEYRGNKVNFVQNFTDIDDKIIRRANEEGVTFKDISEKYIEEFWTDAKGMNIREATTHPKATENIGEIIDIVSTLIDKGYAYEANGDVYFSTKKFNEYGKLSHQPLEDLEAGARINIGEVKKEPMDFALWKNAKPGEPYWESPWGHGRPGWHIECSAMVRRYLGETIDIHCGGQDLIFPHHENEIAQSECYTGKPFANYWMHNGHVMVNGVKMSKSLGNFITAHELLEKHPANVIRLSILKTNYKLPFDFTDALFKECGTINDKVYNALKQANLEVQLKGLEVGKLTQDEKINEIMDDDFNTSNLVTYLLDLVKELNTKMRAKEDFIETYDKIMLINYILGLVYEFVELSEEDKEIYNKWLEYRNNKDFENADKMRAQLVDRKII